MSVSNLHTRDQLSIYALAREIEKSHGNMKTLKGLSQKLGVPLMTENRNRRLVLEKLQAKKKEPEQKSQLSRDTHSTSKPLIEALLYYSKAFDNNESRKSFSPWFKNLLVDLRDNGAAVSELSFLTDISASTIHQLETSFLPSKNEISEEHKWIESAWLNAHPKYRESFDSFFIYVSKTNPERKISWHKARQCLIDLGLHSPRGPKIGNHGARVKTKFEPHALWEGDGKLIKVSINGQTYPFCWYAFTDQATTLIVGAAIRETESSECFLAALQKGRGEAGLSPIGIVLDNRLSDESENGAMYEFCKDHGITIVRTYPGNSKSNGYIENNFSIFERFVGDIKIEGNSYEQISQQIAATIIEVFTQQRNHSPRKSLGEKSPIAATQGAKRPEHLKGAIEKLATRLKVKQLNMEQKWLILLPSIKHFGPLSLLDIEKSKRIIAEYPDSDIVEAQAKYLAQVSKYPERNYRIEYLLGILRHTREEKIKRIFNETWIAGLKDLETMLQPVVRNNISETISRIVEYIAQCQNLSSPALQYKALDALSWWFVKNHRPGVTENLWRGLLKAAERAQNISLRWWTKVATYLYERIGNIMYLTAPNGTGDLSEIQKNSSCSS